jgi:hypothetical protein
VIRNGITVGCENQADHIKKCVLLMDRILKEDYYSLVFCDHDRKWGELEWDDELGVTRGNVLSHQDRDQEAREAYALFAHTRFLEDQDIDRLFSLLAKHIRNWWD